MDRRKKREKTTVTKPSTVDAPLPPKISPSEAFIVTLSSVLGLGLAFYVANSGFSIDLVTDPSRTIFFIWYLRAVGRGLLAVPIGALLNCLGAIALGAPVTFQFLPKTVNWSLMMSLFTTVPASCVLGSSWAHWKRIFAQTQPNGSVEYLICLPAHGAVIGGWFGAWPMPLDWERPWQEWPICVSYGAIGGYMVGLVASCVFVLARARSQHVKQT
ncbi:phosphatidylinositol-glycan biosynthesis class F protein isoform X4 [Arachis ipaensis]|uniref:phosphatidylinositol-glycan biosynthesis class F protein isoform X4 n=1 Tax=Arachis ipaensis TaxID=130454 RepID=UPI000A2B2112|nr:phosphatidylinositol-glycan biosynthesis class F protein isoform X4 [Arachis ipaensis]XP_025676392.1 phosphatidylinositol-glycan biosynthesis class F protein isoform X4 [Arachis hypogaea]